MWAARRDLLDGHPFYDAAIVGGGDVLMSGAAFGCWAEAMARHQMNPRQCRHYRAWAEPFFDSVEASVSYVDCPVYHLWHGAFSDRGYQERHEALRRFDFDPYEDLAGAPDGPWRWNSAKPGLHQYLKDFFAARKEDG